MLPAENAKRREVNRVLIITLLLNLLVAVGKIALGVATGALAILADGFHSLADSASNVVALIANTIAGRPPDADHPYGHQRFETLATLAIGLLLGLTAWETLKGVLERIFNPTDPTLSPLAFGVMLITLGVNIGVNRYELRVGKRLDSDLLIADAAHTGADIFVTLAVLISMGLTVGLGWAWADIVTALIVVGLVLRAAWHILSRSGRVLVDTAPYPPEALTEIVLKVPQVRHVVRARSRGVSTASYIDLDVEICPTMTTLQTAQLSNEISAELRNTLEGVSEVVVRFLPDTSPTPQIPHRAQLVHPVGVPHIVPRDAAPITITPLKRKTTR